MSKIKKLQTKDRNLAYLGHSSNYREYINQVRDSGDEKTWQRARHFKKLHKKFEEGGNRVKLGKRELIEINAIIKDQERRHYGTNI